MSNNTLDSDDRFYLIQVYKWVIPCLWAPLSVAFVGNLLIFISAHWLPHDITPNLRLCISLAAADAWAACLLATGFLVNSYLPAVNNYRYGLSFPCHMLLFEIIRVSSMLTSDFHLFALALNQLYSIWAPLKYKISMTPQRARVIILMLWTAPLSCLSFYCIVAPEQGFLHQNCPNGFYFTFAFRFTIFLFFTLPLLATMIIYSLILYYTLNDGRYDSMAIPLRRSFKNGIDELNLAKRSRKRAIKTTILIVLTFCFSWFPCVLYFTLVCDDCPFQFNVHVQHLSWITHLALTVTVKCLVIIKLTINPFIYTLRMASVREALRLMYQTRCGRVKRRKYIVNSSRQSTYRSMCIYSKNMKDSCKSLDTRSCVSVL